MQTKQQIQQLLASGGIFPNKRLGQNFLIDLNLMRLLIDSASLRSNDVVLEVGCGTGSLTEGLAEVSGRVIAVEFDDNLAKIASSQLAGAANVEVIRADILENKSTIDREVTEAVRVARGDCGGRFLLVANLPYSVACPVMLNLILGPMTADGMYVTVQKEVAERMTAGTGSGHYGVLSIFMALSGDVKAGRILKPTVFWPQPQVGSAMVSFVRRQEKVSRIRSSEVLSELVNMFMQHRRKMVKACTRFAAGRLEGIGNWPEVFDRCCIDPHKRPEQLSPEEYLAVSNLCCEYLT